ncbi:MAG: nucleoside triphosphate pyrophosphohydrolase family protein [Elusimicrobiota bacterium]|jgi:NTP pyrophosphatase (non-canonical NTP hydrolase)
MLALLAEDPGSEQVEAHAEEAAVKFARRAEDDLGQMDNYQREAVRTASPLADGQLRLAAFALGLCGESGEVADLVKKHVSHGHDLPYAKVTEELGDVLWYVANIANVLGFTLGEIAAQNAEKLRSRYPDGFSSDRSRNR